ncbi:MAG: vWA domain-containing protein, partial [Oscillospiraceae bacterium]|nr:vWA domain-containing protein [Oscillospiraceae bacterium]
MYAIVYTVDFHWEVNGKTYDFRIPGGGFISFEHLVEVLDIEVSDTNTEKENENGSGFVEDNADDAIKLNEVEVNEATKRFVADVERVEFSDPELVWVGKVNADATVGELKEANGLVVEYNGELTEEQVAEINAQTVEAGDWALISVQPFISEETLTVIMKNGDNFKIQVTDAQIQTKYLSDSGKLYEVTVTYDEDAMIPEGAALKVTEFAENSEEYRKARNTVLADMIAQEENIDLYTMGLAALDISILDHEGKEIEPAAPVRVDLRIKSLPGVDNLEEIKNSLMVKHHIETENGIIVEKVYDGGTDAKFLMETSDVVTAGGSKVVDPETIDELDALFTQPDPEPDVDISFIAPVFSTFTVTWSSKKTTIHYGYMNGNTFVEFTEPVQEDLDDYETVFLIRDFEGYHYAFGEQQTGKTYYSADKLTNPTSGTSIIPRLYKSGSECYYWTSNGEKRKEVKNDSHIYLVYEKDPDPVPGGTLVPRVVGDDTPPTIPSILKKSVDNGNGTNTLSLSIRGATKEKEIANVADVIVIFDVSGSMRNNMAGEGKYLHDGSYYKYGRENAYGLQVWGKIETEDTRLQHAKDAVNHLADTLYGMNNNLAPQKIRMGLVSFSNTSKVEYTLSQNTDDYTASLNNFKNKVNKLSADGGTNWEAALQAANQMAVASDRDTYVIFVTDGDPTFRYTRMGATDYQLNKNDIFNNGGSTYTYYNSISVFGKGSSDERGNNYDAALAEAKNIVSLKKNLYAIAVSNDVKKMEKLIEDAEGKEAYLAADVDDLNHAFDKIAESIFATHGWGEIKMTDGITDLTNTVAKAGLMNVDGDFVYYRAPAPDNWAVMTAEERDAYQPEDSDFVIWTDEEREAAGCEDAIYERSSESVQWNMGSGFMLEDGVTYKVSFICWPTQEAYDLLADLKNGSIKYKDLTPEQKAQIYEKPANSGNYVVKTNQDGANTTYKSAVQTGAGVVVSGNEQTLPFQIVEPMILKGEKILVRKNWEDTVNTGHRAEKVKFHLLVDGKYYQKDGTFKSKAEGGDGEGAYVIEVSKDTTPTAWVNEVAIAPGVIRGNDVLEFGHSYALEEYEATGGDNFGFSFEFHSAVVRPMVIDSTLTYLIEDDSNKPEGAVEHNISGRKYYSVVPQSDGGTVYYEATGNTGVIEGTNYKTSELDITKIVQKGSSNLTEADLNKETFTYRVTLEVPAGADVSGITGYDYFEYTVGQNAPFKLYGYQPGETAFPEDIARFGSEDDTKKIYRSWNTTNADIQENFLTTNQDGSKTIQMDVTISQLEVFRFTNLPTGTRYTIQEIYANQYLSAEPNVNRYNGGRAPVDKDGNLAEQGYSITRVQSTNGTKTTTEITNDTLTGVIDEANKRYYNQFTNTLGNATDADLSVTKHLENYSWSGERYYFKLIPAEEGNPMPVRDTLYISAVSG